MSRSYSDPSYGSQKVLRLEPTGALNGTDASATEVSTCRTTVMQPIKVLDWNVHMVAGGTNATRSIVLGKSAAGTGVISAIGTIATGTIATNAIKDGSVTETDLDAGDDLVITTIGTSTTVENMLPSISYRERYVQSDT